MKDRPDVRLPPPLVFAACLLGGFGAQRLLPLPFGPSRLTASVGTVLTLAWLLLFLLSLREFHRAKTSLRPDRPATSLIRTGPFRFSRNPLYISLCLLQIGLGFHLANLWIVLMAAPAMVALSLWIVPREEEYLLSKFGEECTAYMRTVRRWL